MSDTRKISEIMFDLGVITSVLNTDHRDMALVILETANRLIEMAKFTNQRAMFIENKTGKRVEVCTVIQYITGDIQDYGLVYVDDLQATSYYVSPKTLINNYKPFNDKAVDMVRNHGLVTLEK